MDDTTEAGLPPAYISIRGFWERLTSQEVVRVRRDFGQGYTGVVLWGDSLLPEDRRFELTRAEFLDYEYDQDLGFSVGVSDRLPPALVWVIGAPPMENETVPNTDQLELARRLLRGSPAPWPWESRSAAERVLWNLAERKTTPPLAVLELCALAPATHTNTAPLSRALVPAVTEGRLGRYEAIGLLADSLVPDRITYDTRREILLSALPDAEIPLDAAILLLRELHPTAGDHESYTSTGQVSALHAERELLLKALALLTTDARAVEALRAVIDNEAREDAFTVKVAIWALGRQNGKSAIGHLIPLLDQPQYRIYRTEIEEALSFLCSGAELVPKAQEEEEKEYWTKVSLRLPTDAEAWWRHDAESVFWEKRLRCARTLDRHPGAVDHAVRLQDDEVPVVRVAARGLTP
jgi:hypothetical protein